MNDIKGVFESKKKNGDIINTMNVAHHILEDHFKNIIQVVSLSEMAHKGWHAYQKLKNKENAKFFLSIDCAFGDLKAFVENSQVRESFAFINNICCQIY